MQHVPVTIYAGFEGRITKVALRQALHVNPLSVTFRVESNFHGEGDVIGGNEAAARDWSLQVHDKDGASKAVVDFGFDSGHRLTAVVR